VDHSVTVEPVVAALRLVLRVGTVAHVDAVQVVRDLAHDLEAGEGELVMGRRMGTDEVGIHAGLDCVGEIDAVHVKSHRAMRA
jgi:hypothetical protein